MSRPQKAVVEYFPHFVNHGKTIFTIENRFGNDGYAFWFKTLELLGSTEHHFIDCNNDETWEYLLAVTRLSAENAVSILDLLSTLGAINKDLWKIKVIRSDNFIENLDVVYSRRQVNVISNSEIVDLCKQKYPLGAVYADIKPQSKVKERKVEESKGKKSTVQGSSSTTFDEFWLQYPKKKAKGDAEKAWAKIKPSKELFEDIIYALSIQKTSNDWIRDKGQYIPYPATWLNRKGWLDEIDIDVPNIETNNPFAKFINREEIIK